MNLKRIAAQTLIDDNLLGSWESKDAIFKNVVQLCKEKCKTQHFGRSYPPHKWELAMQNSALQDLGIFIVELKMNLLGRKDLIHGITSGAAKMHEIVIPLNLYSASALQGGLAGTIWSLALQEKCGPLGRKGK